MSHHDTERQEAEGRDESRRLAERLASLRPGLPCCEYGTGACTGGTRCWHDEPDNIPEEWE